MQAERHLGNPELSEVALAEMTALGDALRAELNAAADRPQHFWMRQGARIQERIAVSKTSLRWPIAAMAALAAVSFALLSIKTPSPAPAQTAQRADADDLLLRDIQHSLAHRAPQPLMPASILVQEMTNNPRNQDTREN